MRSGANASKALFVTQDRFRRTRMEDRSLGFDVCDERVKPVALWGLRGA